MILTNVIQDIVAYKKIFTPTKEHYLAQSWCFKNEIKVFPKPIDDKYYFVMVIDGVGHRGRKTYSKKEYAETWWGIYLYLYKKYKDDRD